MLSLPEVVVTIEQEYISEIPMHHPYPSIYLCPDMCEPYRIWKYAGLFVLVADTNVLQDDIIINRI